MSIEAITETRLVFMVAITARVIVIESVLVVTMTEMVTKNASSNLWPDGAERRWIKRHS